MACKRLISSSRAAKLLRVLALSSTFLTRSITSLSNATLWAYAFTAASGHSFVESNCTASWASSRARFSVRRQSERCECSVGSADRVLSRPDWVFEGSIEEINDWDWCWKVLADNDAWQDREMLPLQRDWVMLMVGKKRYQNAQLAVVQMRMATTRFRLVTSWRSPDWSRV